MGPIPSAHQRQNSFSTPVGRSQCPQHPSIQISGETCWRVHRWRNRRSLNLQHANRHGFSGRQKLLGNVQGLAHGTSFPTQNVCKATVTKSLNDLLALSCTISDKVEPSEIFAAKIKLASDPEALAKLQSEATAVAAPAAAGDAKKEANAPAAKEESSDDESVEELDMDF